LIRLIDAWVLGEACRQGRRWIDEGLPALTLSVNLSPQSLNRGEFSDVLVDVLDETGFPSERLEIELTESAIMEQGQSVDSLLNSLREYRVRIAIDDFGTGFSSFAQLKRLPVSVLKIDKGFIEHLEHSQIDREMVGAMVSMAHVLGMNVVAEGIETAEQLSLIRAQKGDRYQGFLASPAVTAEEFAAFLSGKKIAWSV
jgi:EAL domain-containing protein (putative c-di-GMP-specific phosphodiesterase class I)